MSHFKGYKYDFTSFLVYYIGNMRGKLQHLATTGRLFKGKLYINDSYRFGKIR